MDSATHEYVSTGGLTLVALSRERNIAEAEGVYNLVVRLAPGTEADRDMLLKCGFVRSGPLSWRLVLRGGE